jgi:hypothetical protein
LSGLQARPRHTYRIHQLAPEEGRLTGGGHNEP